MVPGRMGECIGRRDGGKRESRFAPEILKPGCAVDRPEQQKNLYVTLVCYLFRKRIFKNAAFASKKDISRTTV